MWPTNKWSSQRQNVDVTDVTIQPKMGSCSWGGYATNQRGDSKAKKWGHWIDLPNLVMTNSLPWDRWPIEIVDLPMKNGIFPWRC